jgi:hypothetical protein
MPGSGTPVEIDAVNGLREELDTRAKQGTGFFPNRIAVINSAGELESVSGSLNDCVRVDGTAGPCGTSGGEGGVTPVPTFIDTETPAGAADGTNQTFTLSQFPVPPSSLLCYRNGLLQHPNVDYTLSGSTITFVPGAIPQSGDMLVASFRAAGVGSGTAPGFVDSETPAGTVDGVNTSFLLAQAPSPAGSLALFRNGLLQKPSVDFDLAGSNVSFVSGATPETGDLVRASYRVPGSSTTVPDFIDSEAPLGGTDGSNGVFTLAQTPSPGGSLVLFRNGLLQHVGVDHTLSGRTITFLPGAIPQSGDALLASYRVPGVASANSQVLCAATGSTTSAASATSLGSCVIPGGILHSGDRVEIFFDYLHTGTATGFQFALLWGSTTIVSRSGGPAVALASGRASIGIFAGASQWSIQSWGGGLPLEADSGMAPDLLDSPITLDLRGWMSGSTSDEIALRNYTVIRHPAP